MPPDTMWLCALIQVSDRHREQLHTGLLYRTESGALKHGHLAWDLMLQDDAELPVEDAAFWSEVNLHPDTQRVLASRLATILELNKGRIPYSIEHEGPLVFSNQIWTDSRPGQGMTCSTFVRAVLEDAGISLVDLGSWKDRTGDDEWRSSILNFMRMYGVDAAHVSAQEARIGSTVRFRPEDVPAALEGVREEPPLTFEEVAPRAASIRAQLLAFCPLF